MPRQSRAVAESGFHHVIQRGAGKQLIFEDDSDRATLLETVGTHLSNRDMSLLAYCLMDNHVHLLVEDPAGNLSEAFHSAWTTYARRYNTKTGRIGPVFQGRFKSVPVESDPQLLLTARYIHENPKRVGLCPTDTYPWSSYHSYLHDDASGLVSTGSCSTCLAGVPGSSASTRSQRASASRSTHSRVAGFPTRRPFRPPTAPSTQQRSTSSRAFRK